MLNPFRYHDSNSSFSWSYGGNQTELHTYSVAAKGTHFVRLVSLTIHGVVFGMMGGRCFLLPVPFQMLPPDRALAECPREEILDPLMSHV